MSLSSTMAHIKGGESRPRQKQKMTKHRDTGREAKANPSLLDSQEHPNLDDTIISNFWPLEPGSKALLINPPSLGCLSAAALWD